MFRSQDVLDGGEVINFDVQGQACELTVVDYPGKREAGTWPST